MSYHESERKTEKRNETGNIDNKQNNKEENKSRIYHEIPFENVKILLRSLNIFILRKEICGKSIDFYPKDTFYVAKVR